MAEKRQPTVARCSWATTDTMVEYHDGEWGVPLHDDRLLLEFLTLEGAQAGLSWATILKRRPAYRNAFADFDATTIAGYDDAQIARLLADPGIVRNRSKIVAAIGNARAFLDVQLELGSFDTYIWSFVGGQTRHNGWHTPSEVPVTTPEAQAMSADLRRRGFAFVGPKICYAFMQATGMVNDHLTTCFRYVELAHRAGH